MHGAKQFQGLGNCFKYMLKEGGPKSLWRGNGINVLKIAPESALKFAAYEQAKQLMHQFGGSRKRELTIYERFVCGSFAGGFAQSVIYPLEVCAPHVCLFFLLPNYKTYLVSPAIVSFHYLLSSRCNMQLAKMLGKKFFTVNK